MSDYYVVVVDSVREGINGLDWFKDGKPVFMCGKDFVKTYLTEILESKRSDNTIHLCAVGSELYSATLQNWGVESGKKHGDSSVASISGDFDVIIDNYIGNEKELFDILSQAGSTQCMIVALGEPYQFCCEWVEKLNVTKLDCPVKLLSFMKRTFIDMSTEQLVENLKSDGYVYWKESGFDRLRVRIEPSRFSDGLCYNGSPWFSDFDEMAWNILEREGILDKYNFSKENAILSREYGWCGNSIMYKPKRIKDYDIKGEPTYVILLNSYVRSYFGNMVDGVDYRSDSVSTYMMVEKILDILEDSPVVLVGSTQKDTAEYESNTVEHAPYSASSLKYGGALRSIVIDDIYSNNFRGLVERNARRCIFLTSGLEYNKLAPIMTRLKSFCGECIFAKATRDMVESRRVSDWKSICRLTDITIKSVNIEKYTDDKGERVSHVTISALLYIGYIRNYVAEYFVRHKDVIVNQMLDEVSKSEVYRRLKLPKDCLKVEKVSIRSGGIVEVEFSVKEEYREQSIDEISM